MLTRNPRRSPKKIKYDPGRTRRVTPKLSDMLKNHVLDGGIMELVPVEAGTRIRHIPSLWLKTRSGETEWRFLGSKMSVTVDDGSTEQVVGNSELGTAMYSLGLSGFSIQDATAGNNELTLIAEKDAARVTISMSEVKTCIPPAYALPHLET